MDEFEAQTYEAAMRAYDSDYVTESHKYQLAKLRFDNVAAREASQEMAAIRVQRAEYHRMATEVANPNLLAPTQSSVDLTPDEAMKIAGLDPEKKEDVDTYNAGVRKLAHLKSLGSYRE